MYPAQFGAEKHWNGPPAALAEDGFAVTEARSTNRATQVKINFILDFSEQFELSWTLEQLYSDTLS